MIVESDVVLVDKASRLRWHLSDKGAFLVFVDHRDFVHSDRDTVVPYYSQDTAF
jgi:hypothetical protein